MLGLGKTNGRRHLLHTGDKAMHLGLSFVRASLRGWKDWLLGVSFPDIRVEPVPSLVSRSSQADAEGGSFTTEDGVICKDQVKDIWIHLTKDQVCDRNFHCRNLMDQRPCFAFTRSGINEDTLAESAFYPPVYSAIATLIIGCTNFLA